MKDFFGFSLKVILLMKDSLFQLMIYLLLEKLLVFIRKKILMPLLGLSEEKLKLLVVINPLLVALNSS
jgi:hypothetical protein